jgi:excisionase family DNA binding protein
MPIPKELIDAIAERVADIVLDRLADGPRGSEPGTWMCSAEVAQYLGWSRKSVYRRVARMAMPHYKVDGVLLFRRDELDAWLEQYREEPSEQALHVPLGARRHRVPVRLCASWLGPGHLVAPRFTTVGVRQSGRRRTA